MLLIGPAWLAIVLCAGGYIFARKAWAEGNYMLTTLLVVYLLCAIGMAAAFVVL